MLDTHTELGEWPVHELTRDRIQARIEAGDRRAFWALIRALSTTDLAWIVGQALEKTGQSDARPWRIVSFRCARAELVRRVVIL